MQGFDPFRMEDLTAPYTSLYYSTVTDMNTTSRIASLGLILISILIIVRTERATGGLVS